MSDQRDGGISWTDETWNPIRGCSRVSEGCRNCYAEKVAGRFSGPGLAYEGLVTIGEKGSRWNGTVLLVHEHLGDPLRWKRPRRVFVNSMSDLFHESLPFETIAAVFGVMAAAPQHTFQVLTKRPARMREWFQWVEAKVIDGGDAEVRLCIGAADRLIDRSKHVAYPSWPLPNVWLGVSVEDQATANERIPLLLECPAAVRWVSYEPALGPVDFEGLSLDDGSGLSAFRTGDLDDEDGLDWIVVGGESGPGARPFDLAWARSVISQCSEAGIPCFVKQLGARPLTQHPMEPGALLVVSLADRKGGDTSEWSEDLCVRQWPTTEGA